MVLHVEKTLKTTIQKKLQKSQKFARKISVTEFRYSQAIFLRLAVTLRKNNEQRPKSNDQRATSKK